MKSDENRIIPQKNMTKANIPCHGFSSNPKIQIHQNAMAPGRQQKHLDATNKAFKTRYHHDIKILI